MQNPTAKTDEAEKYLAKVTIGDCEPHNSTILLSPYDPGWPSAFARLAELIRNTIGDKVLLLEHVGSTAVPGLSAIPIIDMVLAVLDAADELAYVPPLQEQGFVLRIREPERFEHRLLKTPHTAGHLHVFTSGSGEIDRMVAFRDWLRTHDEDRRRYEAVKFALAGRT